MALVDQDRGGKSGAGGAGVASPRVRKIFMRCVWTFWVVVFAYYFGDMYFYRTVDCTVVGAEAVSGGGGLRSAGSRQSVNTETEECGLLVFVMMQNEGFDSGQDLADELNRHRGERLRFRVSYLYVGHYEARAVELEGFPIQE
ncbi:hypothetical protein [Rothia sp. CCM 9416]|uniref:hypothetical protein n=1 Tax=Rothia sp. CCM 9416 TaxID=3402655 RepID=UPI003AD82929